MTVVRHIKNQNQTKSTAEEYGRADLLVPVAGPADSGTRVLVPVRYRLYGRVLYSKGGLDAARRY